MVSEAFKAAILSLLITGLGQIYLKRIARGLTWLFGGIALGIMLGMIVPDFSSIAIVIPILSSVDAYIIGKKTKSKKLKHLRKKA